MRFGFKSLLPASLAALAVLSSPAVAAPPPQCDLDTPTITCVTSTATSITLNICAGPSGAPAGISIHWMLKSEWVSNGNSFDSDSPSYQAISLSGNCNAGQVQWNLGPNQCKQIKIYANTITDAQAAGCGASGDQGDLLCDTEYVFEVFAHNVPQGCNKSDVSEAVTCKTAACPGEGECTLSWGYWKTHGPAGCNPPGHENKWPVNSLNVGGLNLNEGQLCAILQTNPGACAKGGGSNSGANAVIILEHQLIAAKLNSAAGAIDCPLAEAAIASGDALLDGFENACVGASTPLGQQMIEVAGVLGEYNSDQCSCPTPSGKPQASPSAPTDAKRSSWGKVKSIYR